MNYCIVAMSDGYALNTADELHSSNSLGHYGILRQKWGVRRFQNYDGTLTPAGRERYHKMIAANVKKDQLKQTKGLRRRTKARDKVLKQVQKEFEATAEGKRLKKANDNVAKVQSSMNKRADAYSEAKADGGGLVVDMINKIGVNKDTNRMATALAEQNEAQKAAAKTYDRIMQEHKDDILNATIKDLKIYEIDDGREFLEKYIRGDEDATFSKVSRKQERAEAKAVKEAKKVTKEDPEYIEKIKTSDGDVRYIYDKDELKSSFLSAAKQLKSTPNQFDGSRKDRKLREQANLEITDTAKKISQAPELKAIGADARKINQEMVKEYRAWTKENSHKLSGMDAYANAWDRHVSKDQKLSNLQKQLDEHRDAYYEAAKREAFKVLGTHESSYETDLLASRIGNMYFSEIGER